MSGYVKLTVFETKFDGDNVRVRLKPLLYSDLLKLKSVDANAEAVSIFQEILPAYIEELSGLTDRAGVAVTIPELCSQVYFLELVAAIGEALVGAAQVKNPLASAAPSDS